MKITQEEFESFVPQNNYVLLEPIIDTSKIKFGRGEIYVDNRYKPEHHQPVVLRVIKPPKKLIYSRDHKVHNSMNWKTEMLLKEGDIVIANYLKVLKAPVVNCEGRNYLMVNYEFIFCKLQRWEPEEDRCKIIIDSDMLPDNLDSAKIFERWQQTGLMVFKKGVPPPIVDVKTEVEVQPPDNVIVSTRTINDRMQEIGFYKVVLLNGYILFQNIPEEHGGSLWVPQSKKERYGLVRYIGKPNEQYREDVYYDDDYITTGHIIHTHFKFYKKLENPLHSLFREEFYVTQRRFILGVQTKVPKHSANA